MTSCVGSKHCASVDGSSSARILRSVGKILRLIRYSNQGNLIMELANAITYDNMHMNWLHLEIHRLLFALHHYTEKAYAQTHPHLHTHTHTPTYTHPHQDTYAHTPTHTHRLYIYIYTLDLEDSLFCENRILCLQFNKVDLFIGKTIAGYSWLIYR